ncbi:MAG: ABC transporter ATP-binding protein [Bacteroidia bacterium]
MRTYFNILAYGKSHLRHGLAGLASTVLYSLFSVASLFAIAPFLRILFSENLVVPKPASDLVWWSGDSIKAHAYYHLNEAISTYGPQKVLIWFCLGLLVAIVLKGLFRYLGSFFMVKVEQGVIRNIRSAMFTHLTKLDIAFYNKRKKGEILGLAASDVEVIQAAVIGNLQAVLREPVMMIMVLLGMLFLSWKLTLFTLVILPITGLFINFIAKKLKRRAREGQEAMGRLLTVLDEFIGGIRIVKAFRSEGFETARYEDRNKEYFDTQVSLRRQSELASPLTEILSVLVICALILYSGTLILGKEGDLSADQFILFVILFSQFLQPIKVFSNALAKIQKGIAAYNRVEQLLDEEPSVKASTKAIPITGLQSSLQLDEVSFRYEDGESDVLHAVSFEVQKGETYALVGPSGGGKSTLVDLLPRFHDPSAGVVRWDGKDLRDLDLDMLRKHIGYVTQEAILFHDTVAANIAYGKPETPISEVRRAAEIAYAHDFISALPQGYDTIIGERGTLLSGGQRQRIAIARAVLHNPDVLILDEATSNLDNESEKFVQAALDTLMADRTSIVIAHRLSTIQNADQILFLQDGKIIERGTHASLMELGGAYANLV